MTKALTYEEFQKLAMENYCHGGDAIVECWGVSEFNEYVAEFGPITEKVARDMFHRNEVIWDEMQATIW